MIRFLVCQLETYSFCYIQLSTIATLTNPRNLSFLCMPEVLQGVELFLSEGGGGEFEADFSPVEWPSYFYGITLFSWKKGLSELAVQE